MLSQVNTLTVERSDGSFRVLERTDFLKREPRETYLTTREDRMPTKVSNPQWWSLSEKD